MNLSEQKKACSRQNTFQLRDLDWFKKKYSLQFFALHKTSFFRLWYFAVEKICIQLPCNLTFIYLYRIQEHIFRYC